MSALDERRERLALARLYFVSDASTPVTVLRAALEGGADMLQLRDPSLPDDELVGVAREWGSISREHGALLWLNDRPDLALRAGADGVHVGQDDMPVAEARREAGGELLVACPPTRRSSSRRASTPARTS